jgi:hypothetical protein
LLLKQEGVSGCDVDVGTRESDGRVMGAWRAELDVAQAASVAATLRRVLTVTRLIEIFSVCPRVAEAAGRAERSRAASRSVVTAT